MSRRLTGANVTHEHSSRSHAFLTVHVEKETKPDDERPPTKEVTHMHLVDLVRRSQSSEYCHRLVPNCTRCLVATTPAAPPPAAPPPAAFGLDPSALVASLPVCGCPLVCMCAMA